MKITRPSYLVILFIVVAKIVSAQNVGIGTASPSRAKLEVHGAEGSTTAIFGGEGSGVSLQRNWPGIGFNQYNNGANRYISNGFAAAQYFDPGSGYLAFDMFGSGTANTIPSISRRVFTITNNGNIGIKASPGNATLLVSKGSNFDGSAVFGGSLFNSHFNYGSVEDTYIRGGINGSRVYLNDITGGKVVVGNGTGMMGINSPDPTVTLEIRQTNNKGLALVDPGTWNYWEIKTSQVGAPNFMFFVYNGVGKSFIHSDGSYHTASDIRLKSGIANLEPVLPKLMLLHPSSFAIKEEPNNKRIGLIAQELKTLFPELVTVVNGALLGKEDIPDMHTVNYSGLSVIALKAIQEQQQLIEKLQEQNNNLLKRLEALELKQNAALFN